VGGVAARLIPDVRFPSRLIPDVRFPSGLSPRRQLVSAAAAAVVLVLLTAVLQSRRDDVSLTIVMLLYLAVVVALSVAGGPIVGMSVAIIAFLVVNWFFTEPLHTLNVSDPERLAELIIFLAVSGTVASLVDTASRRQVVLEETTAENEELAAANDLRTALLRAVSHDLRTPLTTAKLATSSLLADDVELGTDQRAELLGLADREIDRLIGIVENLLDAGRLQAGVLTVDIAPCDVRTVTDHMLAGLDPSLRWRVSLVHAATVPEALGDAALLERVLANLVTNAANADPDTAIAVGAHLDGAGRVAVDVVDHGPGLSADQREAALRPFHRIEDRGASSGIGLGLPICAGFCDAMGANLTLRDTPGGGLTARVLLECAP
jgi:two-component system, OmpR family, sensor histidine kinase KdpD